MVLDAGLADLRRIMSSATGRPAPPNHHGTVVEVWSDSVLIDFDDGGGAPFPFALVRHLEDGNPGAPEV